MFEAFRSSKGEFKVRKSDSQPLSEDAAAEEEEQVAPVSPAAQRRSTPSWHSGVVESDEVHVFPLGERANVVFALSYNALIAVIIVFVVFAVLVGFLGYSLGSRPTTAKPTGEGPVGVVDGERKTKLGGDGATKGKGDTGKLATPKVYWRVRLLAVPKTRESELAIKEDIKVLRQHGILDLASPESRLGNNVILYAGKFADREAAERLVERVRKIRVRGQLEFRRAYAVRTR